MRKVIYTTKDKEFNTLAEAQASGLKFETKVENIKPTREPMSADRKAKLAEKFNL